MSKATDYMKDNKLVGEFGIKYLDDRLIGILQNDLILVGARSGCGKSSLANNIAKVNARKGVRVGLFSLENFKNDEYMKETYYQYCKLTGEYGLNYRLFKSGQFEINKDALAEAEERAEKQFDNIVMVNRQHDYTEEKLKNDMYDLVVNQGCEMIILDHLDVLDKHNPNENDNTHITNVMIRIRQLQEMKHIPVIAISHLRKAANGKIDVQVPSIDEFIGSSNKAKQSTIVIVFSPDYEGNLRDTVNTHLRLTWCSVRKDRDLGYDNQASNMLFNLRTGKYENKYTMYKVSYSGLIDVEKDKIREEF